MLKNLIELKSAIVEENAGELRRVVEDLATLLGEKKYTVGPYEVRQCCYTIFIRRERVTVSLDKGTVCLSEEAASSLLGKAYSLFSAHWDVSTKEGEIKTLWGELKLSPEGIEKIKEIALKMLDELIELLK